MFAIIKRLTLGVSLIGAAAAVLLYTDLGSRKSARARPGMAAAPDKLHRVALVQHASIPAIEEGVTGIIEALAARGFFPADWLERFATHGAELAEQPAPHCAPGVELATGSLGHGLPVATGLALAARIERRSYRTVVVLSDGECNEGSVWEAAMFAAGFQSGGIGFGGRFGESQADTEID